jgi:hypothetical protein
MSIVSTVTPRLLFAAAVAAISVAAVTFSATEPGVDATQKPKLGQTDQRPGAGQMKIGTPEQVSKLRSSETFELN